MNYDKLIKDAGNLRLQSTVILKQNFDKFCDDLISKGHYIDSIEVVGGDGFYTSRTSFEGYLYMKAEEEKLRKDAIEKYLKQKNMADNITREGGAS